MAQPPRLQQILLGAGHGLVYFVTLCVQGRKPVLANEGTFNSILDATQNIRRWNVPAGVVMPDHVHLVVTSTDDPGLAVSDFSTAFKRLLRKALHEQRWEWQAGCFDRLLRSEESLHDKWIYIEQNPVRAGLVKDVVDWPYYLGSIAEQNSVGEAVSLPTSRTGKLTASPTDADPEDGKLAASPTEEQLL